MKPTRPLLLSVLSLCLIAVAGGGTLEVLRRRGQPHARFALPQLLPPQPVRMSRPYGMAPVAFDAYIRACARTGIHPLRIGQTIGDHPRSVGYHKRDGLLPLGGQKIDYTAAVDLGTWDLTPAQINAFVDALCDQGFAAFYRHGAKWKGGEHIHAIYAFLPMKPQLQIQVKEFLRDRKRAGKSPRWRAKMNFPAASYGVSTDSLRPEGRKISTKQASRN